VIILGIDPGLTVTGWGVIAKAGSRISHVANGQVRTDIHAAMADRLLELDRVITDVIATYHPDFSAVEEIFVNVNLSRR
jgi:crossover junction endodeoxyribonuclease RuvC